MIDYICILLYFPGIQKNILCFIEKPMSKTVTLRLNDKSYKIFSTLAQAENRTMSNFIETSVLRSIEQNQFVDEYEMEKILIMKS